MEVPKGYFLISEKEFIFLKATIHLMKELNQQVQLLTEENRQLKLRVVELEDRLNKNSTNSHKPPSTDVFRMPVQNNREKTGKSPGAQKGHKGTTLKMVDTPDLIIEHRLQGFCSCGCNLEELSVSSVRRNQVIDLVPRLIEVTEHRSEIKVCRCGKVHVADEEATKAPSKVWRPPQSAGSLFESIPIHPCDRVQGLFVNLLGTRISDGELTDANELCFKNLGQTESEIINRLLASQVNHFDETSMRSNKKLEWVHV
ncbi:MAG: hypothetical protein D4R64_05875 [Porphyromonadaceae bacterium]|nr:MAG: hypothetical protein D4R64_05875 [Porphyromonadaceae bacterium]